MSLEVLEQPHLSTKPEKTKTLRSAELPRPKFDLGKDDHALYGEYNPKFAGRGGEHLVFTIPGHEKIVFKVAHNMIVATLHDVESREGSGGVLAERTLRHQAVVARAKLADIEEFFGREHMARQRVSTMNLPIPAHILRDLYNEDLLPSGQDSVTLPVVVRIQEAIDLRERETLLDLTSSYAEEKLSDDPGELELYSQGSDQWVLNRESPKNFDRKTFSSCLQSPSLEKVIVLAETDAQFRETLSDFVSRAIEYSQNTYEFLDLAGKNNVVFMKSGESWQHLLIDAAYPGADTGMLLRGQQALYSYITGQIALSEEDVYALYNVLNYTRTINALADALGMSERIHLLHEDILSEATVDWKELRRYLLTRIKKPPLGFTAQVS